MHPLFLCLPFSLPFSLSASASAFWPSSTAMQKHVVTKFYESTSQGGVGSTLQHGSDPKARAKRGVRKRRAKKKCKRSCRTDASCRYSWITNLGPTSQSQLQSRIVLAHKAKKRLMGTWPVFLTLTCDSRLVLTGNITATLRGMLLFVFG